MPKEPKMPSSNKEVQEQKQEMTEKQKEKQERLLEVLTTIVRSISNKYDLEVTSTLDAKTEAQLKATGKDPKNTWFRYAETDPRTRQIIKEFVYIPKEDLEDEIVAKGSAAHEAGHVIITHFSRFIPDEVLQQTGFHSLLMSLEERPTDQVVRKYYEGAGDWVDVMREALLNEGEKQNSKSTQKIIDEYNIDKEQQKKLLKLPKFAQLGDLLVFEPHFKDKFSKDEFDQDVLNLYEEIREYVEEAENTLPEDGSDEQEQVQKAKDRYKIFYNNIWPKVQHIIEQDKQDQNLQQMMQQQMQEMFDSLPEDIKKQIIKQILEQSMPDISDELKESLAKSMKDLKPDEDLLAKALDDLPDEQKQELKNNIIKQLLDNLTDEQKKKLLDKIKDLPKSEQDKINKNSEQILKDLEDKMVEDMAGILNDKPETHEDFEEKKEQEKQEAKEREMEIKRQREINKEMQEIEKRLSAADAEKSVYDRTYEQIYKYDDILFGQLQKIFKPQTKRKIKLVSFGSRPNLKALFKMKGAKAGGGAVDTKIFESKKTPEKKDYAFTLLIDLSGSMGGRKIKETFKATVLLAEVLNRLGVNIEILGFQDKVIEFLKFGQKLDDQTRKKISGMENEVWNSNPDGNNNAGYNDDGPCLLDASKSLAKQPNKQKFLLVLSDGMPAGRRSNQNDLLNSVKKILTETDQKLIGIGLLSDAVKNFYPTSLPNITMEQLVDVLATLLQDMILHPDKFKSKSNVEEIMKDMEKHVKKMYKNYL